MLLSFLGKCAPCRQVPDRLVNLPAMTNGEEARMQMEMKCKSMCCGFCWALMLLQILADRRQHRGIGYDLQMVKIQKTAQGVYVCTIVNACQFKGELITVINLFETTCLAYVFTTGRNLLFLYIIIILGGGGNRESLFYYNTHTVHSATSEMSLILAASRIIKNIHGTFCY